MRIKQAVIFNFETFLSIVLISVLKTTRGQQQQERNDKNMLNFLNATVLDFSANVTLQCKVLPSSDRYMKVS